MLSKSTYYYKKKGTRKGKQPSVQTLKNGKLVSNVKVVERIKEIISPPFIDYGYDKTTEILKQEGYFINWKKVYRLMKENSLLNNKINKSRASNRYVAYGKPLPIRPFEIIEIDFKYIWIEGIRKSAYLLTLLDTFQRQAYNWSLTLDMKTKRVEELIKDFISSHLMHQKLDPNKIEIIIRSDNGPQFISKLYRKVLDELKIKYHHIPPATPQMNGHIEAFHSTVERLVCKPYCFESLSQAKEVFKSFYETYNHRRILRVLLYRSPIEFYNLWVEGKIGVTLKNGKRKFFLKEKEPNNGSFSHEDFVLQTQIK